MYIDLAKKCSTESKGTTLPKLYLNQPFGDGIDISQINSINTRELHQQSGSSNGMSSGYV